MFFLIIVATIALLASVYLFLIMPRVRDRADMDMLMINYAHRGLWNDRYPENSLAAFALAAEEGYGMELDIQLSKDKYIMVFHDYNLKRLCGVDKKLCDMTFNELRCLRINGTDQVIPTLSEVLNLIDARVPLLIELKGEDGNTELCKRAAALLDKYHGAFCIESFNPLLLAWFKKYRPRYARGQLVTKAKKQNCKRDTLISIGLSRLLFNFLSRPDFIAVDGRIRRSLMIFICDKMFRTPIFIWTVRTEKDMNTCRKVGCNVIFEKIRPD